MSKSARIEHQLLDSKVATATALFNEWIKWCDANEVRPETVATIPKLFEVTPAEYKNRKMV